MCFRVRVVKPAWLMRRVFNLDVLACPRCGGRLRVVATVQDPLAVQAILAHLARSRAPAPPGPAPPATLLSVRFLIAPPWRRRMAPNQRAIAVPTLAFAPLKQAVPGVKLGVRREDRIPTTRVARRGSRGSSVCRGTADQQKSQGKSLS